MGAVSRLLALVVSIVLGVRAVEATDVAVVDAAGSAVAGALASCLDAPDSPKIPAGSGRAAPAAGCRRVRCEAPGYLPAEIDTGSGRCVLKPASLVSVDLSASAMPSGLEARLVPAAVGPMGAVKLLVPKSGPDSPRAALEFPPMPPGRYALEIARSADSWACRAELGPLGPGRRVVAPSWREPAVVAFKVNADDGKAAGNVTMRVISQSNGREAREKPRVTLGAWTCGAGASPPVTDATGSARVPVDLAGPVIVVAGDWKDPRGLAFTSIDRPPSAPLALTLLPPVRVRGKLEDEKNRPVPCDAALDDLTDAANSVIAAIPGASKKAVCDPQGAIVLGPVPSSSVTVAVQPKPGLPMRIALDPPAPGTTVDLGVLHARTGEGIRVVVQDDRARPVPGANVLARGSAGIVLAVAGVTREDGGVDLTGLPKNSSVQLEVEAKGFKKKTESHLDLDASPFVLTLSRGALVSGSVRDVDGRAIESARVELQGGHGEKPSSETTDERGDFTFVGVDDGAFKLTASAPGFARSEPAAVEIADRKAIDGLSVTLRPAEGMRGRVLDVSGAPVAGARVRLLDAGSRTDLDRASAIAEATSAADGSYQVSAAAPAESWLVSTKSGFGPAAARAPMEPGKEMVLTLTEPAALTVHLPQGLRSRRTLRVKDGAGLGHQLQLGGGTDVVLGDLAPGRGEVGLSGGGRQTVSLVPNETAEVTLNASVAVEGRVTFEGAPSPRVYVTALDESDEGISTGGGTFTDERGRYRVDGLTADPYRIVAVGEDGRAEGKVDGSEGETVRVDLALRSVRLVVVATDGATGRAIPDVIVEAAPEGTKCNSMMGTTSWGSPGELGYELHAGSSGCLNTRTDAAGIGRLLLANPGSYDVSVSSDAYEPWTQSVALGDGMTTKRVSLTRKPDKKDAKPHVIANLHTDPPGLSGDATCAQEHNTSTSSPVSGRFECDMEPGPGEVLFHVEGYGRGRVAFQVPDSGEIVVDVDVQRGGTLVVPVGQGSTGAPKVVDASGILWSDEKGNMRFAAAIEDVPGIGRAWVYRDIPPGSYTATVDGKARSAVPLTAGGAAIAY